MPNFWEQIRDKLTENYDKSPGSKVSRLLKIVADELEEIKVALTTIESWRDIDTAQGATLDRIGLNVEQFRGLASDDIYRVLIKSKIARNRSDGTINTMIEVLSIALDADPSEIGIQELYADEFAPEPAAISVVSVPIARLLEIGMTGPQFGQLVAKMTAAGVGLKNVELFGTFQLSSQGNVLENDLAIGLGDVNDPDVGGTLGEIYQPEQDIILPV